MDDEAKNFSLDTVVTVPKKIAGSHCEMSRSSLLWMIGLPAIRHPLHLQFHPLQLVASNVDLLAQSKLLERGQV